MGKSDQLFDANELQGLTDENRKALDAIILHHLQSEEVLAIIRNDPRIRQVLKEKVGPVLERFKG
jgi:hypothetical protein